jgi:3-phenylpropionate/trans-cinnamate dioxygenase ferredoxin subunit
MTKYRVAAEDEIPAGSLHRVEVDGTAVCLARTRDGRFFAIGDQCTHEQASLSDGELFGTEVECPLHSSRFSVLDGAVTGIPATIPTKAYAVTVEGGEVLVEN